MHLDAASYNELMAGPFTGERVSGVSIIIVDGDRVKLSDPGALPVIVCWVGSELGGDGPAGADLIVDEQHLEQLIDRVGANPIAAASLAVLLRATLSLPVEHALAAESTVYSMLQGSAEFHTWRGGHDPATVNDDQPTVLVDRSGDELTIALNRPHRHNAVTRQLRDELCAALDIAIADDSIRTVRLVGNGPSFCSGGDLDEFGSRPDPAVAHTVRMLQSPARLIHHLRDRCTVHLHGAALGGGIEMAAFAGHVTADPTTRFGLPEVGLGLIPGAGGTASIPRRIGRQRTAALALAVDTIDATTALRWGLIDELVG